MNAEVQKLRPWKLSRPSNWVDPAPPRDWLLEGLALRKTVMLFNGPGSVGKSLLMQQLMTCCAIGGTFLGTPVPQVPSFGWFAEDPEDEIHRRQDDINAYLSIDHADTDGVSYMTADMMDDPILYSAPPKGNGEGRPTHQWMMLREHVRDEYAKLVVIDNVQLAFGGNANFPEQVGGFMREMKKLAAEINGVVVLIQHPSADGETTGSGQAGARAWSNLARSRLYMTFPKEYDDNDDAICNERLIKTKKNNYGPRKGPMRVEWRDGVFVAVTVSGSTGGRLGTIEFIELKSRILANARDKMKRGDKMSLTQGAPDNLPHGLARDVLWKMFSRAEIVGAVEALLKDGRMVLVTIGTGTRARVLIRPIELPYPGEKTEGVID